MRVCPRFFSLFFNFQFNDSITKFVHKMKCYDTCTNWTLQLQCSSIPYSLFYWYLIAVTIWNDGPIDWLFFIDIVRKIMT